MPAAPLPTHLRGSPETARTMRRFQVRKWSKPHRGFAKKALSRPRRGGYNEDSTTPPSCLRQATVSRGRDRLRTWKRHAPCAVSKFAGGQSHTVALPRKRPLTPYTGEAILKRSRQATVSAAQGKRRLGQEMPRTMRRFQVRKWSKPHRGFDKKALSRPSRGRLSYGRGEV